MRKNLRSLALVMVMSLVPGVFGSTVKEVKAGETKQSVSPVPVEKLYTAVGIVKQIAADRKSAMIAHGEIEELKMPAMMMGFEMADEDMLKEIETGDEIKFQFTRVGKVRTVYSVQRPAEIK